MKKYHYLCLVLFIVFSTAYHAQRGQYTPASHYDGSLNVAIHTQAEMDSFIVATMAQYHIPGVAVCIARNGKLIWKATYGYANIEKNTLVNDSTAFTLSQPSTFFPGTALMQLCEQGLIDLDADINTYLPPALTIKNPYYPGERISSRMLLTHTSSIADKVMLMSLINYGGDSPIDLHSFLADYLVPGGQYYSGDCYKMWPPWSQWYYSLLDFTVVAELVETQTGISFPVYCNDYIFQPLNMTNTGWFLSDIDTNNIAMPYEYQGNTYTPFGVYGAPFYPSLMCKASINDMSHFLLAYMNGGEYNGDRILESATLDSITTVHFPPIYGLILAVYNYSIPNFGEKLFYGISGWWYGACGGMDYYKEENERMGIVILTNGTNSAGTYAIWDQLYVFGDTYNRAHAIATNISSCFMCAGKDTLTLTSQVDNPYGNEVHLDAVIMSIDSTYSDTIPMFDDGTHGDSNASDGLWGTYLNPIGIESEFTVGIGVMDMDSADYHLTKDAVRFTTIGPIVCEGFTFVTPDTIINPGESASTRLIFRNEGLTATAKSLTAKVVSNDINMRVITSTLVIGDIAPGEAKISSGILVLKAESGCPGNYEISLQVTISSDGYAYWQDTLPILVLPTGIQDRISSDLPRKFMLDPAFPNPFNPVTTLRYGLPESGKVTLKIFNAVGREICSLVNEEKLAGTYELEWNAVDFPSGVYLCQLKCGEYVAMVKLTLLK